MVSSPIGSGQSVGPTVGLEPDEAYSAHHLGPSEGELARMADEIILAAAMDHIEQIAENVMQEGDEGPDQVELSSPSISFSVWAKDMKEKLGPERGKIIDEAKEEVMGFFVNAHRELGQEKYDEMEAKLLDQAAVLFDNKLKEAVCLKEMEDHTPNIRIQNSVVRRRKKEKGFNMSPNLQVVGLDFDYDSDSEQGEEKGLNEWIENLKRRKGYEKGFCKMIDEAQQEVITCFDKALRESDRPCVKWVHKATSYMLSKIEGYEEKKKIRAESVKVGKWVDLLKEEVGMDLIMEALREIKSYMSVVYDCKQQVHVEDEKEMAKKACIILVEIINASQKGAVLGPGTVLGRQLRGHIELLGGKICRWAWRRFGSGYPKE
nr:hypothetical protein Iba_contig771CG0010 [Ipomoea batatas]